jgi:hypothetical protein
MVQVVRLLSRMRSGLNTNYCLNTDLLVLRLKVIQSCLKLLDLQPNSALASVLQASQFAVLVATSTAYRVLTGRRTFCEGHLR